jgi:hypothetical protein
MALRDVECHGGRRPPPPDWSCRLNRHPSAGPSPSSWRIRFPRDRACHIPPSIEPSSPASGRNPGWVPLAAAEIKLVEADGPTQTACGQAPGLIPWAKEGGPLSVRFDGRLASSPTRARPPKTRRRRCTQARSRPHRSGLPSARYVQLRPAAFQPASLDRTLGRTHRPPRPTPTNTPR